MRCYFNLDPTYRERTPVGIFAASNAFTFVLARRRLSSATFTLLTYTTQLHYRSRHMKSDDVKITRNAAALPDGDRHVSQCQERYS